jgi:hypothetical protein
MGECAGGNYFIFIDFFNFNVPHANLHIHLITVTFYVHNEKRGDYPSFFSPLHFLLLIIKIF